MISSKIFSLSGFLPMIKTMLQVASVTLSMVLASSIFSYFLYKAISFYKRANKTKSNRYLQNINKYDI